MDIHNFAQQLVNQPFTTLIGEALEQINALREAQVIIDCVVTSPPYFQKRTYGSSAQEIGNESDLEYYLQNLVAIFAAVPLAPWGNVWVTSATSEEAGVSYYAFPIDLRR